MTRMKRPNKHDAAVIKLEEAIAEAVKTFQTEQRSRVIDIRFTCYEPKRFMVEVIEE